MHLLCCCIYPCCPTSPPPCLSAAILTGHLVCHYHYPTSPPRLHCHPTAYMLWFSSHYLPSSRVLCYCCLSIFSDWIFSLLYIVLYHTACSIHINFLTLCSDLLTTFLFSLLARLFSLCVIFSLRSNLPRFLSTCLHSALLQSDNSPHICLLQSACSISNMLNYYFYAHALIWLLRSAWIR